MNSAAALRQQHAIEHRIVQDSERVVRGIGHAEIYLADLVDASHAIQKPAGRALLEDDQPIPRPLNLVRYLVRSWEGNPATLLLRLQERRWLHELNRFQTEKLLHMGDDIASLVHTSDKRIHRKLRELAMIPPLDVARRLRFAFELEK